MMWVGETYRGVLVKLVGGDVVDGEDELDVVLLGLVNERLNVLRAGLIEQRVADLHAKINQRELGTKIAGEEKRKRYARRRP